MTIAMGDERRCSTVTTALLVLVACNLTLTLSTLSPPPPSAHDAARVEPASYLASVASSVLAAYVIPRHGRRLSVVISWTRSAMTALYVELLTTAMASLLLTLRAILSATASSGGGEALAVSASVAIVAWLGPALFAHSDIACRMGLVVAAVEEGIAGRAAVERAEALVTTTGGRARGVAVAFASSLVERAASRLWSSGAGAPPAIVAVAAGLAARLAACYACAAFYYQCRARHERGKDTSGDVKVRGVEKCCEIGWDDRGLLMVDETEIDAMDSVFGSFRLT